MSSLITLEHFSARSQKYHLALLCSSSMDRQLHYHDYYQLCYVTCGLLTHNQEGTSVTLGAGDAFIIPPGFNHSLHFEQPDTRMYSLAFEQSLFPPGFFQSGACHFLDSLLNEEMVRLRVDMETDQCRLLEGLLGNLLLQQQMECPPGLSAAPGIVAAIVSILAQRYYCNPKNAEKLEKLPLGNTAVLCCVEYIDRNYAQNMQLSELARTFGLAQSTLCSAFPQVAGMPLHKYIAHKRITAAQVLIRSHPDWPISRIASEVGYEEDSTFYRNFMKIAGMSPSAYRRGNGEG